MNKPCLQNEMEDMSWLMFVAFIKASLSPCTIALRWLVIIALVYIQFWLVNLKTILKLQ